MRHSYLTAGITLPSFFRLLRRNKIGYHPRYLIRILVILQSSFWSSVFSVFEKARYKKKIAEARVPDDPVFIIGHWRSGSTLLHQLLRLDPEFMTPTLFQVAIPDSFLYSHRFYRPVMSLMVKKRRPMDDVRLGMDEPQEDEYALYRMTTFSPLERLVFPKSVAFFLNDYEPIPPNGKDLSLWEEKLTTWFKKLTLQSGKTIISKNPFHSWRIRELVRLFPNARFIHIYRNPIKVVPSAIHMWKIVFKQNCLNNLGKAPDTEDVILTLDRVLRVIKQDSAVLNKGKFYEMRFENLEKDPVQELNSLYKAFGLKHDIDLTQRVDDFLKKNNDFRKNTYTLSAEDDALIRKKLQHHMDYFNYR